MKAIVLLPTVNISRMTIWRGATKEWYHHVLHAPSGTSTPVLMGYVQVLNTINSWLLQCVFDWYIQINYQIWIVYWSENLTLLFSDGHSMNLVDNEDWMVCFLDLSEFSDSLWAWRIAGINSGMYLYSFFIFTCVTSHFLDCFCTFGGVFDLPWRL